MTALNWPLIATLIGAAAALAGLPLTLIVVHLRAIREDQRSLRADFTRRVDRIATECERIGIETRRMDRRYTTKEEWIRETMLARRQLGRLTELMARLQAELESSRGLANQFVRSTHAIIALTDRLGQRLAECSPDGTKEERA
ncbi:MAG: hypothetical protein ACE5E1_07725 [Phycisphaerae bacterium]